MTRKPPPNLPEITVSDLYAAWEEAEVPLPHQRRDTDDGLPAYRKSQTNVLAMLTEQSEDKHGEVNEIEPDVAAILKLLR